MMNKEQEHVQCLRQYTSKLADLCLLSSRLTMSFQIASFVVAFFVAFTDYSATLALSTRTVLSSIFGPLGE